MVLINGMVGIGTGFSTNIPSYNPYDIIKNIESKLNGKPYYMIKPFYRDFKGKIIKKDKYNFVTKGKYHFNSDTNSIHITELPIGKWTDDYIKFIQDNILCEKNNFIIEYENHSQIRSNII